MTLGGLCEVYQSSGSRDSLFVERQTRDRMVASSNPGRNGGRIFSPELTVCADFFSVSRPPRCYRSGT